MSTMKRHADATEEFGVAPASKQPRSDASTSMSDNAQLEHEVVPFPTIVPMEYPYRQPNYFIRACYHEYYELVFELFNDDATGVTITGTPGIGKSLFMAYSFSRYRREYPDATITMACFNQRSTLSKVVIVQGREEPTQFVTKAAMNDALVKHCFDEDPHKKNIWLFDGPPKRALQDVRWVVFTNPKKEWKDLIRKSPSLYPIVYMPVWTMEELCHAATTLERLDLLEPVSDNLFKDLGADPADLDESLGRPSLLKFRFDIFGGVPRVCFRADYTSFFLEVQCLEKALMCLTADQVSVYVNSADVPPAVHQFLHYVPVRSTPSGHDLYFKHAKMQVASTAIEGLLMKRQSDAVSIGRGLNRAARYILESRAI